MRKNCLWSERIVNYNEQILNEINKLKNGDYSTYENFYNLTAQYIYKILTDVVGNSIADTLIVDVYNSIYAGIGQVDSVEYFYSWSGMIATDIAFAYANSCGGIDYSYVGETFENVYERALDDREAFIPDTILQDMEQQRIIQNTIDAMPIIYKIVIQYYYYENLSLTDIAYKLNVSPDVIKKILSEVKNKLKVMLSKYNGGSNRFYSLAEIPLLWVIFSNVLNGVTGVAVGAGTLAASAGAYQAVGSSAGVLANGTGLSGVGVAGNGSAVSGVGISGTSGSGMIANGTVGSGVVGGSAAGGVVSGGVAGTTGVAVAGGSATAASVGFFSTVAGKIVIGATLVATLGGGGVLIHNAVTNDDEPETGITTEISEVTEEATLTDATPTDMVVEVTTEEVTTEEVTEDLSAMWTSYAGIIQNYLDWENKILSGDVVVEQAGEEDTVDLPENINREWFKAIYYELGVSDVQTAYVLHDINSDDIPELFVGINRDNDSACIDIYDSYTYTNGELIRIQEGNINICDNGVVSVISGDYTYSEVRYYKLNVDSSSMEYIEGINHYYGEDIFGDSFFYTIDNNGEKTEVSDAEYYDVLCRYVDCLFSDVYFATSENIQLLHDGMQNANTIYDDTQTFICGNYRLRYGKYEYDGPLCGYVFINADGSVEVIGAEPQEEYSFSAEPKTGNVSSTMFYDYNRLCVGLCLDYDGEEEDEIFIVTSARTMHDQWHGLIYVSP